MRRTTVTAAALFACPGAAAPLAGQAPSGPAMTAVADDLDNPRGVTAGPWGVLRRRAGRGAPDRGGARVLRVEPGKRPTVFRTGFTQITGIAFGPDGSLYVTQLSTRRGMAPSGGVVKVAPDGTRTMIGVGSLFFPAGAAVDARGDLYVSNWSVLPGTPARGGPFAGQNGQLVRLATGAAPAA